MNTIIQNVIDELISPMIPIQNTVDQLLFGDPSTEVSGIAVTFLATQEILEEAAALGVNLLISHEGIFFSHMGSMNLLKHDPVYVQKCHTIEDLKLSVFRYHDYIHRSLPDGVTSGLLKHLGWKEYETLTLPTASIVELPQTTSTSAFTVQAAIDHIKKSLGVEFIRYMGDPSMPCRRIGVLVGYRGGGESVLPLFHDNNVDLVLYGEGPEWETPEYVRDAISQGRKKALIVLGHAESEMPGMEQLALHLQKKYSDLPVHFIPQKPLFKIG